MRNRRETDAETAIQLLETEGALVHPGHFYDFHSEGYLVISLITPEAEFQQGMAKSLLMFST